MTNCVVRLSKLVLFAEEMEKVNQLLARQQQKLDADRERDSVAFAQERDQLDAHREALREEADNKAREEVAVKIRDLEASAEEDVLEDSADDGAGQVVFGIAAAGDEKGAQRDREWPIRADRRARG